MKKIFTVILSLSVVFQCISQNSLKQVLIQPKILVVAGPGVEYALGDFSDTHSIGFSGTVGGYAKISNEVRAGISVDENYFLGKKIPGTDQKYDGENLLRLVASVVITNSTANIILGLDAGIANISSNGFNENKFTFGVKAGIPILGKLPLFGKLFNTQHHTAAGSELLIFITPKITGTDKE